MTMGGQSKWPVDLSAFNRTNALANWTQIRTAGVALVSLKQG